MSADLFCNHRDIDEITLNPIYCDRAAVKVIRTLSTESGGGLSICLCGPHAGTLGRCLGLLEVEFVEEEIKR